MLINYRSIKFKPGILLLMLVLVLIVQALFFHLQHKNIEDKIAQVNNINLQQAELLSNINQQVQQADLTIHKYLTLQDEDIETKLRSIWQQQIMTSIEDLDQERDNKVVYNSLKNNLLDLEDLQQTAVAKYLEFRGDSLRSAKAASLVLNLYQQSLQDHLNKVKADINYWKNKLQEDRNNTVMAFKADIQGNQIISAIILALGLIAAALFLLKGFSGLNKGLKDLEKSLATLSKGNLPKSRDSTSPELNPLFHHVNSLSGNFGKIRQFALEIGEGKFENDINVFERKGEIGSSLIEMTAQLKKVAEIEKQRIWMNEGFAKFGDLLRKNSDSLKEMTDRSVSQLVKYLDLNQGAIFINEEDKDGEYLFMASCYAYNRKKYTQAKIRPGEDLVGQCFLEKDTIFLTDVPENYINITSGLGEATARNIFIVPLIFNQQVYGVLEVASFNVLADYQKEFIIKIAENLASAISLVKNNQNTRRLLEEAQDSAEQLRAQEEELRQNMEELAATQEEMRRNQNELAYNEAKIRMIYENAFDAIITFNKDGQIDLFNPAAAKIFSYQPEDINGQDIHNLLYLPDMKRSESLISQYVDGYLSLGSKQINLKARRRNGEIFPIRVKLEQSTVGSERVFIMFLEDISKEEEIRSQIEKNEKMMQEKEANLLALINNTNDTIFAIDKEYRITVVNDVLKEKYAKNGIKLSEGLNILELLPSKLADYWKKQYDRALAGEQFSYLQENEHGEEKGYTEVYLNPIKNAENEVIGISVLSRDITKHLQHFHGDKQLKQPTSSQKLVEKMSKLDNLDKVTSFIKQQISQNENLLGKIEELGNGHTYNGNGNGNGKSNGNGKIN